MSRSYAEFDEDEASAEAKRAQREADDAAFAKAGRILGIVAAVLITALALLFWRWIGGAR